MGRDEAMAAWDARQARYQPQRQSQADALLECDVGPVILPTANTPLANYVREKRRAEGRLVESWDWFYANPIVNHDAGDEA